MKIQGSDAERGSIRQLGGGFLRPVQREVAVPMCRCARGRSGRCGGRTVKDWWGDGRLVEGGMRGPVWAELGVGGYSLQRVWNRPSR